MLNLLSGLMLSLGGVRVVNQRNLHSRIFTIIGITVGFLFYEYLKEILLPNLSKWQSHILSVLVVGILSIIFLNRFSHLYEKQLNFRVSSEAALKVSEERYRRLTENAKDLIYRYRINPVGFEYVSPVALSLTGYTPEDYCANPYMFNKLVHPDDQYLIKGFEYTNSLSEPYILRWLDKKSNVIWIELCNVPIYDNNGVQIACEGIVRDITQRKKAEEVLRCSNDELEKWVKELEQRTREMAVLSEMTEMLQNCHSTDEAYNVIIIYAQKLFPNKSGALYILSPSKDTLEAVGEWGRSFSISQVFSPNECWGIRRGRLNLVNNSQLGLNCNHVSTTEAISYLCIPLIAHGDTFGMLHVGCKSNSISGSCTQSNNDELKRQLVTTLADHIALALANLSLRETLRFQAIRDSLTGLYNRRYMEESLEREIRRAERKGFQLGVIMLDVDYFKRFNDTFGHDAGDVLLRDFGAFLMSHVRKEDIACRYGGEEFILVLPETSLEETKVRAEQIREEVKSLSVRHLGQTLGCITLSMGVSCYPKQGLTVIDILCEADKALYLAKAEGRDRVVICNLN